MSNPVKSVAGVSIVMVLGYLLSFAKEAIIANYYGVSEDVDAYTIAIQIPVLLFAFISVAIRSVIIPIYSDILFKQNKLVADEYVSRLITIIAVVAIVAIFIGELFSSQLIYLFAPGFNEYTHVLSTKLLRLTFPIIIFTSIQQVLIAMLNVHKKFIAPTFAVYFLNIGLICCIVILHAKYGIAAACIGQIVGEITSFLFVVLLSKKIYHFHFAFKIKDTETVKTLKMTVPVLWSISIAEVNAVVNRMIGSFLCVGSISALSYASKINSIVMSFFVSALTTVVFPMLAESSSKDNRKQLNDRTNIALTIFSLLVIPLMFGVFLFKREIVSVLFERGNFNAEAVETTQALLGIYSIGLLFMAFRSTVTNVFYSLKDTRTPAVNATWGAVINIILNIVLAYFMGVDGLALATSITAIFITSRLLYQLIKNNSGMNLLMLMDNAKGIILSSIIMFVVIWGLKNYIVIHSPLLRLSLGAVAGIIIYAVCLIIFKVPILELFKSKIKR